MLVAACPDFLVPQERPAKTADLDDLVFLVPPDSLDVLQQFARNPHHHPADHAHPDPLDRLDLPEPPEALDAPDLLGAMETMELKDNLDLRDLLAPLEMLDPTDNLETQDPQLSLNHSSLETQDHKETLAHKVFLETQVLLEPMDSLATLDQKVPLDPLDLLVQEETMDSLALVAHLVPQERGVSARNIVLWMVEFSSKMVHAVKRDELSKDVFLCLEPRSFTIFVVSFVAFCTW